MNKNGNTDQILELLEIWYNEDQATKHKVLANYKSDIDLLISFKPMDFGDYADSYFDLADKFENLFQRPVVLVTDKSLSNPYFINSVNQTKTLIYG